VIYENGRIQETVSVLSDTVCLEIRGIPSSAEYAKLEETVAKYGKVRNPILKAPWQAYRCLSVPEGFMKIAVAETSALSEAVIPDDAVIELQFTPADDLSAVVTGIFGSGKNTVSAFPADPGAAETAAQYEKLSRDLIRYRKKGGTGVFAPFAFDFYGTGEKGTHLYYDIDGNASAADDKFAGAFTEAYVRSGVIAHLTDGLTSSDVIGRCVECAICLSAE